MKPQPNLQPLAAGQLWIRKGQSRRIQEIHHDDAGVTHIRFRTADGTPVWVTEAEFQRWAAKAVQILSKPES